MLLTLQRLAGASLVVGLALAGCAIEAEPDSRSSTPSPSSRRSTSSPASPSTSATPAPTVASPESPTDWITGEHRSENYPRTAGHALPRTSRVGVHEGYERVVVEYSGKASDITWHARWTDVAISDGKGDPLDIGGSRFLQISIAGVRDPNEDEAMPQINPGELQGTELTKGVHVEYPFEGVHSLFIGTETEVAYKIMVLENPTRIVVDLRK
ncbi:MAG: hypothetical protein Q3979_01035 [Actinomycetaceae bacterium]|nr:hypothetical protein [Actinomycetaceae bacterium]